MMKDCKAQGFEAFVAEQRAKENFLTPNAKKWRDKNFTAKEAGV